MPAVIASILAADRQDAQRSLARLPASGDPVELRVDLWSPDEIAATIAASDRDCIVTVRGPEHGGLFAGSPAQLELRLRSALDAGARWVDVEHGGPLAAWADGPDARRTILSHHGSRCTIEDLRRLHDAMACSRADRLKIVAQPESVSEVGALRDLLRETSDPRLCAFGIGTAGAISRLLAPAWGSWGSYAAASRGAETAEGQFTVDDLHAVYDVCSAGPETRLVALAGSDILPASPSPAMHNAGYRALGLDRLYVPLQCDRWDEVIALTAALEFDGLAVTMPFKGHAAAWVEQLDDISGAARAVNTVVLEDGRTRGANTDAPAAIGCLETRGLGALDDVDILGGGGTARAIAAALSRTGRRPVLWTRSALRGEDVPAGVPTERLARRRPGDSDWLVNATPLRDASLLGSGPPARRGVLDVVYGGGKTELVRRAEEHGLAAIDGFELLVAQAERQFRLHTGRDAPPGLFAEAGQRYLAGLG